MRSLTGGVCIKLLTKLRHNQKEPTTRKATIEPNEQSAIGPAQIQSTWRALPQEVDLMPQYQDFSFKPSLRFEAVAQSADENEGSCDHSAIMFCFAGDRQSD
jgi:hypothetical protein